MSSYWVALKLNKYGPASWAATIPTNPKHLYNIYTTSAQRLRCWSNIAWILYKCFVLAGMLCIIYSIMKWGLPISWTWSDDHSPSGYLSDHGILNLFYLHAQAYYKIRSLPYNYKPILGVNPLAAKFFNWNFHQLEVVSRWRDPQLQVSENYSDLTKWRSTNFKSCWLMSRCIFNRFKRWYVIC